jgi:hypothetical protein
MDSFDSDRIGEMCAVGCFVVLVLFVAWQVVKHSP